MLGLGAALPMDIWDQFAVHVSIVLGFCTYYPTGPAFRVADDEKENDTVMLIVLTVGFVVICLCCVCIAAFFVARKLEREEKEQRDKEDAEEVALVDWSLLSVFSCCGQLQLPSYHQRAESELTETSAPPVSPTSLPAKKYILFPLPWNIALWCLLECVFCNYKWQLRQFFLVPQSLSVWAILKCQDIRSGRLLGDGFPRPALCFSLEGYTLQFFCSFLPITIWGEACQYFALFVNGYGSLPTFYCPLRM